MLAVLDNAPACPPASPIVEPAQLAQRPRTTLASLPIEMHWSILDHIGDEDSVARLCGTNKYWRSVTQPRLVGQPGSGLLVTEAVKRGRKHALGRALNWTAIDRRALYLAQTPYQDADGMTLLMHAAAGGHMPMVRLLLRHKAATNPHDTDKAGLTARHWARLEGHQYLFDRALKNAHFLPRPSRFSGEVEPFVPSLHQAIALGQKTLANRLLTPFFEQHSESFQQSQTLHLGFSHSEPLECGFIPMVCALCHSSHNLDLFENWWRAMGIAVPDGAQAAHYGRLLQAAAHSRYDAHKTVITALTKLGLDIHAPSDDGHSYYQRWLARGPLTPETIGVFRALDKNIVANTPYGEMLLRQCLRKSDRECGWIIRELLQAGVMLQESFADRLGLARQLVSRFYLDDATWLRLVPAGTDLSTADTQGRTLAHEAVSLGNLLRTENNLLLLAKHGIDITQQDAQGRSPVCDFLFATRPARNKSIEALHAAAIALDRPGRVENHQGQAFAAHTMFEAALFTGDLDSIDYMFEHNIACASAQLADASRRLKNAGASWPKVYLKRLQLGRAIGMRSHYAVTINPAGGWHDRLSRKRLAHTQQRADAKLQSVIGAGHKRFWPVVRKSAIDGAVVARRAAVPLTKSLDAVLGTQKTSCADISTAPALRLIDSLDVEASDRRAGGAVGSFAGAATIALGAGIYAALLGTALPLAINRGFRKRNYKRIDDPHEVSYAAVVLPFIVDFALSRPITQLTATLGCAPKALVSAAGLAVGGTVGIFKAVVDRHQQRHQPTNSRSIREQEDALSLA